MVWYNVYCLLNPSLDTLDSILVSAVHFVIHSCSVSRTAPPGVGTHIKYFIKVFDSLVECVHIRRIYFVYSTYSNDPFKKCFIDKACYTLTLNAIKRLVRTYKPV